MLSGGADNAIKMFDVTTGQATQVGAHESAVKNIKWIDAPQPAGGLLASGSWDKTVKVRFLSLLRRKRSRRRS